MEKRHQSRRRQRLTCEIESGDERHTGIVRDLSPEGLFIQTRARLAPEARLTLRITVPDEGDPVRVVARVARVRAVPGRLQQSVVGGVGLEVLEASEGFRALAERLAQEEPEGKDPTPAARSFRVRLVKRGTPQARILTIHAPSSGAARARAGARLGRDWKVTEVEEA